MARETVLEKPQLKTLPSTNLQWFVNDSRRTAEQEWLVARNSLTFSLRMLLLVFVLLLAFENVSLLTLDSSYLEFTAFTSSLAKIIANCCAFLFLTYKCRSLLFSSFPWFCLSFALYYGCGPLLYFTASEKVLAYANSQYTISTEDLIQTHILNSVFFIGFLFAYLLLWTSFPVQPSSPLPKRSSREVSIEIFAVFCIFIGLVLRFNQVSPFLPSSLPSFLSRGDALLEVSLFPLAFLGSKKRSLWYAFYLILLINTATGLLMFQKTIALRGFVIAAVSMWISGANVGRLVSVSVVGACLFFASSPVISTLRIEHGKRFGRDSSGFLDRLSTVSDAYYAGALFQPEQQGNTLSRINYAHVQAFGIHQYQQGLYGDSYKHIFWSLVPRLLAPDKPIITDVGVEFSIRFNGNRYNSVAIGIPGEAYHNGGYVYVGLVSLYLALLFFTTDSFIPWGGSMNLLLLPCYLMIIWQGLRIDGHLVADHIGGTAILVFYWTAIRLTGFTCDIKIDRRFQLT